MILLKDLIGQRDALEAKINAMAREQKASTIEQIRKMMIEGQLTLADLGAPPARSGSAAKETRKVAIKYRDQAGNSWSGRGLKPKWLKSALDAGSKIEEFLAAP